MRAAQATTERLCLGAVEMPPGVRRAVLADVSGVLCSVLEMDTFAQPTNMAHVGGPLGSALRFALWRARGDDALVVECAFRLAGAGALMARLVAASVVARHYAHLADGHARLLARGVLDRLHQDPDVAARAVCVHALEQLAPRVDAPAGLAWLCRLCQRSVGDAEPAVRQLALACCTALAASAPAVLAAVGEPARANGALGAPAPPAGGAPPGAAAAERDVEVYLLRCKLLPLVTQLADDANADVRAAVAAASGRIVRVFERHWSVVLLDQLCTLLGDGDPTVRYAAVGSLVEAASALLAQHVEHERSAAAAAATRPAAADGAPPPADAADAAAAAAPPSLAAQRAVVEALSPAASKCISDPSIQARAARARTTKRALCLSSL